MITDKVRLGSNLRVSRLGWIEARLYIPDFNTSPESRHKNLEDGLHSNTHSGRPLRTGHGIERRLIEVERRNSYGTDLEGYHKDVLHSIGRGILTHYGTNSALSCFGFDGENERTDIILAYSVGAVRLGIKKIIDSGMEPSAENLTATIDMIARNESELLDEILYKKGDIVSEVRQYYTVNPLPKIETAESIEQTRAAARYAVVQRHIFGRKDELRPTLILRDPNLEGYKKP